MDRCDTPESIKLESCTYWEPICSRLRDADEGNGNGRCSMCVLRHLLRGRHWAGRQAGEQPPVRGVEGRVRAQDLERARTAVPADTRGRQQGVARMFVY